MAVSVLCYEATSSDKVGYGAKKRRSCKPEMAVAPQGILGNYQCCKAFWGTLQPMQLKWVSVELLKNSATYLDNKFLEGAILNEEMVGAGGIVPSYFFLLPSPPPPNLRHYDAFILVRNGNHSLLQWVKS